MPFIGQTSLPPEDRVLLTNFPCDVTVAIGDWVRLNGSNIAVKAQADTFSNSHVIGLVEAKATTTLANILLVGASQDIFVGLDETKEYFLSSTTAGAMAAPPVPTAAGEIVYKLGQPISATKFFVYKGIRMQRS